MKIINPPISLCSSVLEFLYEFEIRKKECRKDVLEKHFRLSRRYLNSALSFLRDHNLITHPKAELIAISEEAYNALNKSLANSKKVVLEKLMTLQPFIEFTYFLGKDKSEKESIRLALSLYDIKQNELVVLKIFKEWINLLGIKISESSSKNKTLDGIKDSLQNKLYANNFIKEFLGDDLHNVSGQVVEELSDAIKEIPKDNESSINEAGRALEDFLRVDLAQDVDLTNCSGIGEIGNELNKHNQYPKKLNNLCVGLSSIRSMGKAHGSDRTLKVPWLITEHGVIGYIIMVLSVIKSYLIFQQENKLIF